MPTAPRVEDCACSIAAKVGFFQRLLFEGESSSDMVAGVRTECLRSLSQVDIVALDDYSAVVDIEMIALALCCVTVSDAAAESL